MHAPDQPARPASRRARRRARRAFLGGRQRAHTRVRRAGRRGRPRSSPPHRRDCRPPVPAGRRSTHLRDGGGGVVSEAAGGVVQIGWFQLMLATGFGDLCRNRIHPPVPGHHQGPGDRHRAHLRPAARARLRPTVGLRRQLTLARGRPYPPDGALRCWNLVKRSPDAPEGIFGSAFVSMALTGFIVTFAVTGVIVQVEPWYLPQYVIPLAGMVIGNSMTGIALSIERLFADMDVREGELLAMTALGATPWEAAHGSIRLALRAGDLDDQLHGGRRARVHPGDDGRPDSRRRRPRHRDGLPDRGDAHGLGSHCDR